tara:strand:- start:3263 stop:4192 length:930 start_codon:yes stop_codon:yes gene_type:complete
MDSNLWIALLLTMTLVMGFVWWFWPKKPILPIERPFHNSNFVELGDLCIHYQEWGNAKKTCILLVHGLGASSFTWRLLAPLLAKNYYVIALDLPGFGYSTKDPNFSHNLEDQSLVLKNFLLSKKIKKAHLVGSSMGGAIVMYFAMQEKNMVASLTAISPATEPRFIKNIKLGFFAAFYRPVKFFLQRYTIKQIMREISHQQENQSPEVLDQYLRAYRKEPNSILCFAKAVDHLLRDTRMPSIYKDINIKLNLLWGDNDRITPIKMAHTLESIVPECELHILSGGLHHIMEDDPPWCAKIITQITDQSRS